MSELQSQVEWGNSMLPFTAHSAKASPLSLTYTVIAEPKFGKTSWACSFPDSILAASERGHSFIEAHKVEIDVWDYNMPQAKKPDVQDVDGIYHMSFMQFVDIICASDRFKIVVIDTADNLAKKCLDYHLKKNGLMHPQDWEFGKGHDVCMTTPFRQAVGRILATGRGVIFITHSQTNDKRFAGNTQSKKECTLPTGITKFLIPQSDIILHGRFGPPDPVTKRRTRIFQTEGSDEVLAGARGVGQQYNLPPKFIVDQKNAWEQWNEFFQDDEAAARATAQYEALKHGTRTATTEEEQPAAKTKKKAA
jgi:hypothetical protein